MLSEIHRHSHRTRLLLWGLSVFVTLSIVGYFLFTAFQRQVFVAINSDSAAQQSFFAQQDANAPKPLAAITRTLGSLTASIGTLFGIDRTKGLPADPAGFDRQADKEAVYLLPLAK